MIDWQPDEHDIAIVGMTGRFPGAGDLGEFWSNLRDGVESISLFSDEELEDFGVSPAALRSPDFVKAAPILEHDDRFDAAFFGYSPHEAALLDPQQRLFLECAWHALESAGYAPGRTEGAVGVFAGMSMSSYLLFNLLETERVSPMEESFQLMIGTDKDFLATRVSYHLDLTGPSMDLQTGCSTSLVATHLACESLLSFECDLALAGGVSVQVPQRRGYFYREGDITSPDGHCRAFDADGRGTLFGSGLGVVVLKRAAEAIEDGDTVWAVIKGSAVNNDGSHKIGFTAPGVDGQAEVIARAQAVAGIDPETVDYVEAHGTGTELGDPVEVSALCKAFGETDGRAFCGLGSVKTNIGHLDAAAGVAGLIKTVLALTHKELPPSLHFRRPNPRIDFDSTPFYVNAELQTWDRPEDRPRRAGVSSFGIGGTNAHVILEEAPPVPDPAPSRPLQLLTLSARSRAGLGRLAEELATRLEGAEPHELADAAFTLQTGRRRFEHRRAVVCDAAEDAVQALGSRSSGRVRSERETREGRPVVFMFPGGGAQHVRMGEGLYRSEPVFRGGIDRCAELLREPLGEDIRNLMYSEGHGNPGARGSITRTSVALPLLFAVEYALARLWISWSLAPSALIGHSLGEYTAACLAGVFSLEDALDVVVYRGRLFEEMTEGGMLSLPLPLQEVEPLLEDGLSLAAVNGPSNCVVSGSAQGIERMAGVLDERELEYRRLQIDVAAHSSLVEPLVDRFRRFVEGLRLEAPQIPLVSNLTGRWLEDHEALDPDYWARQLRHTVRFGEGVAELLADPDAVLLEVGPGNTLTTLAQLQTESGQGLTTVASMRHPYDRVSDEEALLGALGKLWLAGVDVDWSEFYREERRRRIPLPTYPFDSKRYWIEPSPETGRRGRGGKLPTISDWFYVPVWKSAPTGPSPLDEPPRRWLLFSGEAGVSWLLAERLEERGDDVVEVRRGEGFERCAPGSYRIDPNRPEHYRRLLDEVSSTDGVPAAVHLWSVTDGMGDGDPEEDAEAFERVQKLGLYSVVLLAQALEEAAGDRERIPVTVVSDGLHAVESGDASTPAKAPLLSASKVIPQEHPRLRVRTVDVGLADPGAEAVDALVTELESESDEGTVALRKRRRWVQGYEPIRLTGEEPALRRPEREGVYVITGGLGKVGLQLAHHFAQTRAARLVLVGRSEFPDPSHWDEIVDDGEADDSVRATVKRLQEIEKAGGRVLVVRADVADRAALAAVFERAAERFGGVDGVVHAAGLAGEQAMSFLGDVTPEVCRRHFAAKIDGVRHLAEVCAHHRPEFVLLFSSNVSILGGLGSLAYAAANLYMDAFANRRAESGDGIAWISANWDGWLEEGQGSISSAVRTSLDEYAMQPVESLQAFDRVVRLAPPGQVVVSTGDLDARMRLWLRGESQGDADEQGEAIESHERPDLDTEYLPPENELEEIVVSVWGELLGIKRIGMEDNFFDLGGNSLVGLKVVSRLKKRLGVEIPVVKLFEAPTVRALTQSLSREDDASYQESQSRGERRRQRRRRRRSEA